MLDHLGRPDLGAAVLAAIEAVLSEGRYVTPDLGGPATTREMGDAVVAALYRQV